MSIALRMALSGLTGRLKAEHQREGFVWHKIQSASIMAGDSLARCLAEDKTGNKAITELLTAAAHLIIAADKLNEEIHK